MTHIEQAHEHLMAATDLLRGEHEKAKPEPDHEETEDEEALRQGLNHALDLADRARMALERDLPEDHRIQVPEPEEDEEPLETEAK